MSNLIKSGTQNCKTTNLTPIEIVLGIDVEGRTTSKKLYEFLELNSAVYSRWCNEKIIKNDFAEEGRDYEVLNNAVENPLGGRPSLDYKLSASFAKKLAMGTHNEKGEIAKKYFIMVEDKLKEVALNPYKGLSKEVQAIFAIDKKTQEIEIRVGNLESNMPLFNVECKELQSLVRKVGIKTLGGYKSPAYNDNSLRGKVYSDIQQQLKREFGVSRYEAIKRVQLETAKKIIEEYKVPIVLADEIQLANNQMSYKEVI